MSPQLRQRARGVGAAGGVVRDGAGAADAHHPAQRQRGRGARLRALPRRPARAARPARARAGARRRRGGHPETRLLRGVRLPGVKPRPRGVGTPRRYTPRVRYTSHSY